MRQNSERNRTPLRGGVSPGVVIATSAGLVLIVLVVWLAWPRGEKHSPSKPIPDRPETVEPSTPDWRDSEAVDEAASWPSTGEGIEPDDETRIREPGRFGGAGRDPVNEVPDGPREPATPMMPILTP